MSSMSKLPTNLNLPVDRNHFVADAIAGLTFAVVNVPQAMGNAVLATVNPVAGLYTLMIATPVGALFTGSVFMNVSTTGALSVAAGDALVNYSGDQKTAALITLALLIGVFQLAAGLLRLGSLIRFVSQSVMTGFITGIALLIILGAIPDVTGYTSPFNSEVLKLADTMLNFSRYEPVTFILGLLTIALIVGLGYTPARKFSMVLSLVVVTLVGVGITAVLGESLFVTVGDITTIPRSLPRPALPDLLMIPALVMPALAISIIGLVQGAGVSQSYPNPDGKFPDVSRDFTGQGIANMATSFFTGIPGGGSMSGTAVTVNAGARSRWANILAGFFVILIVLLFAGVVKLIPMSALAGLLIVVGFQNLQPQQIMMVWQTGRVAQTAMVLTLIATLALPLQYAIVIGVAISIMMHVFRSSNQVRLVEFVPVEGGFPIEQPAPLMLANHEVTLLYAYGSLFFAAAATFEKSLPNADDAKEAVVILILRGQPEVGSTFIGVLRRYATTLQANGGHLMLTGVNPRLRYQLERTGTLAFIGEENVFMEQAQMGVAMNEALASAHTWLETVRPQEPDEP
ncbi:MAG: SulP family inorganic anion transporter [Anaerolineales bacterium]|nr:SulP family inorganic anion transporter [Anaerolineales bacterium]